jgi:hypothetical protein
MTPVVGSANVVSETCSFAQTTLFSKMIIERAMGAIGMGISQTDAFDAL